MHIPASFDRVATTAFVPFDVRPKISDGTYWVERASAVLLQSAVDAATRVADSIKRRKSELSTETGLARLQAEIERIVAGRV
jgi:hypothetical protein